MIKTLYPIFQKWSEKGSVYIISDTHFEDGDCLLMDECWLSPDRHLENIKQFVNKQDTLIHLGDVGNPDYFKELECYKVLIMGNHDKGKSFYERNTRKFEYNFPTVKDALKARKNNDISFFIKNIETNEYEGYVNNNLFHEVYTGPLMVSDKLILSHEPLNIDWAFNIHGHDHNKQNKGDETHLNLASNVVDYQVFNLGQFIKQGGLSKIKSIHRQTIDEAERKKYE